MSKFSTSIIACLLAILLVPTLKASAPLLKPLPSSKVLMPEDMREKWVKEDPAKRVFEVSTFSSVQSDTIKPAYTIPPLKGSDGENIDFHIYLPNAFVNDDTDIARPVIIRVYGGGVPLPLASRPTMGSMEWTLASFGCIVVALQGEPGPNNKGKPPFRINPKNFPSRLFQDIEELYTYLTKTPRDGTLSHLRPLIQKGKTKVFVMGSSFGGYVAARLATTPPYNHLFDGYISINGIYDYKKWINSSTVKGVGGESGHNYLFSENKLIDDTYNQGISPLYHLDNLIHPILLLHGTGDLRVDPQEMIDYFKFAKEKKKANLVKFHALKEAGHGSMSEVQRESFYEVILDFVAQRMDEGVPKTHGPEILKKKVETLVRQKVQQFKLDRAKILLKTGSPLHQKTESALLSSLTEDTLFQTGKNDPHNHKRYNAAVALMVAYRASLSADAKQDFTKRFDLWKSYFHLLDCKTLSQYVKWLADDWGIFEAPESSLGESLSEITKKLTNAQILGSEEEISPQRTKSKVYQIQRDLLAGQTLSFFDQANPLEQGTLLSIMDLLLTRLNDKYKIHLDKQLQAKFNKPYPEPLVEQKPRVIKEPHLHCVSSVDTSDPNLLQVAKSERLTDVVKYILEDKDPLIQAAHYGLTDEVKTLIEAEKQKNLQGVGTFLNHKNVNTMDALSTAINNGHADTALALIQAGADLDQITTQMGQTPLIHAAFAGMTDVVKVLIERKKKTSNPQDFFKYLSYKDIKGVDAMFAARNRGHEAVAALLKEAGAVDVGQDGRTQLMIAAAKGDTSEVLNLIALEKRKSPIKLANYLNYQERNHLNALGYAIHFKKTKTALALIVSGTNLDELLQGNNTPLHIAAISGEKEVVEALVKKLRGVRTKEEFEKYLHLKNDAGQDAITAAADNHHDDIVQLLQQAGKMPT
ncbi:MAG: ankyrin repeat domain-containing protein [Alphaproteobacteria bacterium]|nr:ankyrin repeat domain-containing protein [Alphaproteobacteria bacterium]